MVNYKETKTNPRNQGRTGREFSLRHLLLLLSLGLVEFVRAGFFIGLYPLYATRVLGLSIIWVGVILSAHYLSETLMKPLAGAALDVFPRRLVLTTGLGLGLFGLIATISVRFPVLGLIGAVIWGAGVSPVWLAVLGAGREAGEGQGRWMSQAYAFWLGGTGCSLLAVNFMMQSLLWAVLVMLVVVWGLALLCVTGTGNVRMIGNTRPERLWLKDMLSFLHKQWAVFGGVLLQTMAASMLVPILPLFATNTLGLTSIEYAVALGVGGTFVVVIMLLVGRLVDRRGPRTSLVLGFVFCGVGVILMGSKAPATIWITALALTVLAVGYGLVLPAWNTFVATIIPSGRQASAWGLYTTAEGIGVSIGPAFGGLVSDTSGLSAAFLVSGLILVVLGVFYGLRFHFGQQ